MPRRPRFPRLRALAERGLDLFRSQYPAGQPSWDDFTKASVTALSLGLPAFLIHLVSWALYGAAHLDPEPITKLILFVVAWTLGHFAYLVARRPHTPADA